MSARILPPTLAMRMTNRGVAIILCLALVLWGNPTLFATMLQPQEGTPDAAIPNEKLDSLVAPIALYPDPLLSQILVASTYPLEIVQLSQWTQKNSNIPKEKMVEEAQKQDWDPSVQALVVFPDLVKILTDNIKTTTEIGNAFLAQQSDVMDAVQRMRAKAKGNGHLQSTEQQTVESKVIDNKEVIMIEPSSPDIVYVPSYDPVVVYGADPFYPYPPYYYPPYYSGGLALSFGLGMMIGAAWGGGWGWNSGWGGNNNVYVNHHNNFVRNSNRDNLQGGNRVNPLSGRSDWKHNPQHRGGTPYSNRATAQKYGGSARGDSLANRQATARQNQSKFGGRQQAGTGNRGSSGTMNRGTGGDRVGNRSTSSGSRGSGAFGGGGSNRSSSMASSSRGMSSMSRGGGMRGGGRRR